MNNKDYIRLENKLGFNTIRSLISGKCSTQYGKDKTLSETISTDREVVSLRLDLTDEMRLIIMFESSFPDSGFVDCLSFLIPLKVESSYIDLVSLNKLGQALETLKKIITFFEKCDPAKYPRLKEMSGSILFFPEILRRIDLLLDKYGEIRDNASPELLRIRTSIKEKSRQISGRIESILKKARADGIIDEETSPSVRDGRILIPVPAANKKKINGFVYDESATGRTSFIEPVEVAELNNRIRELQFAEQREIMRILIDFSEFLRPYLPELIESAEYMGEIDFIRAKAFVASDMRAGKPILSEEGEIKLYKARHPILEKSLKKEGKEIVPLSLTLTPAKHILLISGPNAGGKSVCLKTLGILQYMFQWGMLLPCSETSEFTLFDKYFIDIGDDQSIENDLSTYSSHLTNMKTVLESADNTSLVLIDEFGSGTEPAAGGAIAEQILYELEKRGVYGVITTHYTNLKFYANNSSGVINGAMLFDVRNIQPLFKLEIGLPGNSFAFELARKIGLAEGIIKGAEERAGSEFVSIERNLRKIAKNKRVIDEKLIKIKHTDKTLDNITEKYQKELTEIQALRKSIIDQAKKEAAEIIQDTNKRIEATIKEIRESQAEKERTRSARKELDKFTKEAIESTPDEKDDLIAKKMYQIVERQKRREQQKQKREAGRKDAAVKKSPDSSASATDSAIKVGDRIKIKENGVIGEVVSVDKKEVVVSIGDIISRIRIEKVEKIASTGKPASKPERKSINIPSGISERKLNFKPYLDIRGERLEDAINIVRDFIDDALMLDMSEIKILHGKGNGILRTEIRKYIKSVYGITSFRDEDIRAGGSGITIIDL